MRLSIRFFKENPVWTKVSFFSLIMFLVLLADGIVSFWAPSLLQATLNNSFLMGLVIGFQSVIGFLADLIFPAILRSAKVRQLLYLAMMMAGGTSLTLVAGSFRPYIWLFLLSMTLWGIYYELVAFGTYQFMDNVVPLVARSAAWGIYDIFKNLSYLLGPLVASWLLVRGNIPTEIFVASLLVMAALLLLLSHKASNEPWGIGFNNEFFLWQELTYWWTLVEHIWPIIIMTLVAGMVDATFWTTGVIWTQKLTQNSFWGSFLVPAYQLPPLFLGVVLARLEIYKGKKIAAEKMLLISGLLLTLLFIGDSVIWKLLVVLASSIALAFAYPLMEGVYSDIVARMGHEKKHLIGLTSSVVNIAYVIWPPVAGFLTLKFGEGWTFSLTGLVMGLAALILLFITPKKLKLPQAEIQTWI